MSVSVLVLVGLMIGGCQSRSFKVKDGSSQADASAQVGASAPVTSLDGTPAGSGAVEAGYSFAEASSTAAANRESPPLFGSLFSSGSSSAGSVVPPPPSTSDSLPANTAPVGGLQRVSLTGMGLRDAVGLAIANHPDVSRYSAVVSQSAAEVSVAKAAWFPVLEYSVSPGYGGAYGSDGSSTGAKATIGASQLLYDFGKTSGSIELAEATLGRQRHTLNSTIENVAYSAAAYYIQFAAAQATLEAARGEIEALRKTRTMISDRVKAGLSDASDLTQADVAMQRAIVDQVKAQTNMDVAAGNLAEIIGVRPKSVANLMSVSKTVVALSKGDRDIENSPGVLASKEAINEAEAKVKVAKANYFPSISVAATKSLSSGGNNANNSSWVGLSVSGALSSAGENIYRVDAAKAEKLAADRQLESQKLSTRTTLTSAETETAGAGARQDAFSTMKDLSRTSRDLYWQEYTLNKRPLYQVLDAERDIFSAESERITAIADGLTARIKAHTAVGSLVRRLRER